MAAGFVAGAALGASAGYLWQGGVGLRKPQEVRASGYKFINPLLDCELAHEALENRELQPFRDRVESAIGGLRERGVIESASVYFRDLNNGPWFTVNDVEDFRPASLLKVPLMIAALRAAEEDPSFLGRRVAADLSQDLNQLEYFKPQAPLGIGGTYTVEQVVETMVRQSDNNANAVLLALLDPQRVERTLAELGVGAHGHQSRPGYVSVTGYAAFLRILYNASYLNRASSEKALSWLAASTFERGLVAGLPPGVTVAHKFGEAHLEDGTLQLHDCGIVYAEGRPYLLCVMTRGASMERLAAAIAEVSRVVWEEVSRQRSHH